MDTLRAMRLFIKVAETGSFKQAAKETNYSSSMLSKEIEKLEQLVGARLLQRSTRNVQLTEIGQGYLLRCHHVINANQQALGYVQEMQGKPKGLLKVNAPMTLGITDLGKAFGAFMAKHPDVELDVDLSDKPVDLIAEGYDVGLRAASEQIDSNYIGKPIAKFPLHLVTTQKYLDKYGPIDDPSQLSQHNCFRYSLAMGKNRWRGAHISGNVTANNTIFLREAVLQGGGVAQLPGFVCAEYIRSGELVELFINTPPPELTFYVLYPSRHYTPPKLASFVQFMVDWFKTADRT